MKKSLLLFLILLAGCSNPSKSEASSLNTVSSKQSRETASASASKSQLAESQFFESSKTEAEASFQENEESSMITEEREAAQQEEPASVVVQLPVVPSVQENAYYCVPAVLQAVLRLHGIEKSQSELAMEMNTSPVTGTEYADLAASANRYLFGNPNPGDLEPGYHLQRVSSADAMEEIRPLFRSRVLRDLETGDPVFCAINTNTLDPSQNSANHMVLVIGYSQEENDKISYILFDPSYLAGPNGAIKTVSEDLLLSAIIKNEEPAYLW